MSTAMALNESPNVSAAFACPACGTGSPGSSFKISDLEYGLKFVATYVECTGCGTLSQTPMPSFHELANFYPASYHSFHNRNLIVRAKNALRLATEQPSLKPSHGYFGGLFKAFSKPAPIMESCEQR